MRIVIRGCARTIGKYLELSISWLGGVVASRSLPEQRVAGSIPALCKSFSHQAANWYSFGWKYTLLAGSIVPWYGVA